MSDIRIYDFEFNLLKVCSRFVSSNWSIYYNDIGTFEAHFPIDDDISKVLFENDFLIAKQGNKEAIITGKQIKDDIAVYGRTVNWMLSRRIIKPLGERTGVVEELTKQIIEEAFSDIYECSGGIYFCKTSGSVNIYTIGRTEATTVFDAVKDCLLLDNAGHRLSFDVINKMWVFEVVYGEELSLVVSEESLNSYDTEYNCDVLDYFTGGWYKCKNTEETGAQGETWEYLSKEDKNGMYKWDCILNGSGESEASMQLSTKIKKKEILQKTWNLKCGEDYNLGDIVSVKIIKGSFYATVQKRIVGVNFWYESNEEGEQPIFE